jgi:hypothetical protein
MVVSGSNRRKDEGQGKQQGGMVVNGSGMQVFGSKREGG